MASRSIFLIALDLDGTLLRDDKRIALRNKVYLRHLQKEGHVIVLASGRPEKSVKAYYDELGLKGPMISYNGALLTSPYDPSFHGHSFRLPKETARKLAPLLRTFSDNVVAESEDAIWMERKDPFLENFFLSHRMKISYGRLEDILTEDPFAFIAAGPTVIDEERRNKIRSLLSNFPELEARFWPGGRNFEIAYRKATKGNALLEIAKYYGIPRERIIAFGDGNNDLPMLDVAGLPFLMVKENVPGRHNLPYPTIRNGNGLGVYKTLRKLARIGYFSKG